MLLEYYVPPVIDKSQINVYMNAENIHKLFNI